MCITNVGVNFFKWSLVEVWQEHPQEPRRKEHPIFWKYVSKYFRHSLSVLGISLEKEVCMLVMQPWSFVKETYMYIFMYM